MFKFDFHDMLVNTISISRPSVTKEAGGGTSKSWAVVYSGIPASVQPLQGYRYEFASKLQEEVDHVVYLDQALDVRNGDRLNDGTNNYLIDYMDQPGGTSEVWQIYCKKISE